MEGDKLKELVNKRTGLIPSELVCPREKTQMTPCAVRDGDNVMLDDKTCLGCGILVYEILEIEERKHK